MELTDEALKGSFGAVLPALGERDRRVVMGEVAVTWAGSTPATSYPSRAGLPAAGLLGSNPQPALCVAEVARYGAT